MRLSSRMSRQGRSGSRRRGCAVQAVVSRGSLSLSPCWVPLMLSKPFWKSRTFWFNAAVLSATWLLNHKGVMAQLGLDADAQAMLIAGANLVLRFLTT